MGRCSLAVVLLLTTTPAFAGEHGLTISRPAGHIAHLFPTVQQALALNLPADTGPLLYHPGGEIMPTVTITPIFWAPKQLQDGSSTSLPFDYRQVQRALASRYPGHGIANNNTQYYQTTGGVLTFIQNDGRYAGSYADTSPYPIAGCSGITNCITDAQIETEITNVITAHSLKHDLTHLFLIYTSAGENSCFDSTASTCSYAQFCAYHSYYALNGSPVIYGNEPYGDLIHCQVGGTPSPNADPAADAAASIASHEITEAITDPMVNAWFSASGNEIGDLCAYNYGPNTWPNANQFWPGATSGMSYAYFELQEEFDDHIGGCVQIGP